MACDAITGVKNVLMTFTDCDTEEVIGPISHKLASTDLPTIKTCAYANTAETGGHVTRAEDNATITINLTRDIRVPLAWYQGCAAIDIQIEYINGTVYTGLGGAVTESDESDTRSVTLTMIFREIDEMLPTGSLADAA